MNYTHEIIINLPVSKVVELFDNPDNLKHWQTGLVSFEHISGTPGQAGAKSKLRYKMGNREIEMIETIVKRDLPREFTGTYETKGVYNKQVNRFSTIGDNKTKWVSETEFRFSGFMKVLSFLMPGMFKKQSYKFLEQFKTFAEGQKES